MQVKVLSESRQHEDSIPRPELGDHQSMGGDRLYNVCDSQSNFNSVWRPLLEDHHSESVTWNGTALFSEALSTEQVDGFEVIAKRSEKSWVSRDGNIVARKHLNVFYS